MVEVVVVVDCDVTSVVVSGIMVEEVVVVEETVNVDRASVGSYCVKTTVEVTEIININNHYFSNTYQNCYKM